MVLALLVDKFENVHKVQTEQQFDFKTYTNRTTAEVYLGLKTCAVKLFWNIMLLKVYFKTENHVKSEMINGKVDTYNFVQLPSGKHARAMNTPLNPTFI